VLLIRLDRGVHLDDQKRAVIVAERAVGRVLHEPGFATDVVRELRQQSDELVASSVLRLERGHEDDCGHHSLLLDRVALPAAAAAARGAAAVSLQF
jgi:hypothetical protein